MKVTKTIVGVVVGLVLAGFVVAGLVGTNDQTTELADMTVDVFYSSSGISYDTADFPATWTRGVPLHVKIQVYHTQALASASVVIEISATGCGGGTAEVSESSIISGDAGLDITPPVDACATLVPTFAFTVPAAPAKADNDFQIVFSGGTGTFDWTFDVITA